MFDEKTNPENLVKDDAAADEFIESLKEKYF